MTNIFQIINYLYTKRDASWINEIENTHIQPYVIQRWLCMNDRIRVQTRWLDKYVFVFSDKPKMYLSLAWSVLPKSTKAPFIKYIKKQEEDTEFDFILDKVRKHFKLSDNDFRVNRERLLKEIKKDMPNWFAFYGVPKKYWKKNFINFNLIKEFGPKKYQAQQGLGAFI